MWTIANILTAARIAMIPLIVALFYCTHLWAVWAALAVYILACVTDFFDGYLARQREEVTALGRFLDPIADKLLVVILLMVLVGFDRLTGVWVIPALLILFREIMVAGLREFLGPSNIKLPVSKLAKWKTTIQMVALGFLIVGDRGDVIIPETLLIGQVGVAVASVLTLVTGYQYLKTGISYIREMDQKS